MYKYISKDLLRIIHCAEQIGVDLVITDNGEIFLGGLGLNNSWQAYINLSSGIFDSVTLDGMIYHSERVKELDLDLALIMLQQQFEGVPRCSSYEIDIVFSRVDNEMQVAYPSNASILETVYAYIDNMDIIVALINVDNTFMVKYIDSEHRNLDINDKKIPLIWDKVEMYRKLLTQ